MEIFLSLAALRCLCSRYYVPRIFCTLFLGDTFFGRFNELISNASLRDHTIDALNRLRDRFETTNLHIRNIKNIFYDPETKKGLL